MFRPLSTQAFFFSNSVLIHQMFNSFFLDQRYLSQVRVIRPGDIPDGPQCLFNFQHFGTSRTFPSLSIFFSALAGPPSGLQKIFLGTFGALNNTVLSSHGRHCISIIASGITAVLVLTKIVLSVPLLFYSLWGSRGNLSRHSSRHCWTSSNPSRHLLKKLLDSTCS